MMSLKREILVNGFKACGLYPFNPDAINYEKCLGATSNNVDTQKKRAVSDLTTMSYSTFKKIIGPSIKEDFENRNRNMPHQKPTEHLDILYQVWKAFYDAETTNITDHEVDIPAVVPQKQDQDLKQVGDLLSSQEQETFKDASLDYTSFVPEAFTSKQITPLCSHQASTSKQVTRSFSHQASSSKRVTLSFRHQASTSIQITP